MEMKEEWLMPGAVVPVDAETTAALVAEIKRLIGVVGGMALGMQPAQEPVAYVTGYFGGNALVIPTNPATVLNNGTPLYTTPPQRKPLTDEEIDAIYTGVRAVHHEIDSYVFARAIEAKLKEG